MTRSTAAQLAARALDRARRDGDPDTIARMQRGLDRAQREESHYTAARAADAENVEAMRQLAELHRAQTANDLERTHGNGA